MLNVWIRIYVDLLLLATQELNRQRKAIYSEQRNLENIDEQIWKKLQYSKFQKFSALACFKGEKSFKKYGIQAHPLLHI
jgi:hypothetical protein